MPDTTRSEQLSPGLLKVVERARREPEARFFTLAHLIDVPALKRAYGRIRKNAAVGVDGVTKEEYGRDLEENLQDLHARMKAKRYRHQPIRRVQVPKASGGTRPIGISVIEDKIVQDVIREVLNVVYEHEFLECSYGFRPGRSAHDAVRAISRVCYKGKVKWILEADIMSFFDSIDRKLLQKMLEVRVPDGSIKRLVGKCLHVGILEGEVLSYEDTGTAQGSVLSPLLGNIYLHYALDRWFERDVKPQLAAGATLVRYADDFVILFERKDDATRVMELLEERLSRFGLSLHPEKTQVMPFKRPTSGQTGGKGPSTFDFLGFTFFWKRSRKGRWQLFQKTRSASLRRFVRSIYDWCRRHRHQPIAVQHQSLCRRIQGHFSYFGVSGNQRSLLQVLWQVRCAWFKWLCRRSQRKRLNSERFADLLRDFPLPPPRIAVSIWGT